MNCKNIKISLMEKANHLHPDDIFPLVLEGRNKIIEVRQLVHELRGVITPPDHLYAPASPFQAPEQRKAIGDAAKALLTSAEAFEKVQESFAAASKAYEDAKYSLSASKTNTLAIVKLNDDICVINNTLDIIKDKLVLIKKDLIVSMNSSTLTDTDGGKTTKYIIKQGGEEIGSIKVPLVRSVLSEITSDDTTHPASAYTTWYSLNKIQTTLDTIAASAGLTSTYLYSSHSNDNTLAYIKSSTTLDNASVLLDKALLDTDAAVDDLVECIGASSWSSPYTGYNYISTASSLIDADIKLSKAIYPIEQDVTELSAEMISTARASVGTWSGIENMSCFSGQSYQMLDSPTIYVPDYIRDLNNNLTKIYFKYGSLRTKDLSLQYYQGDGYNHTTDDLCDQVIWIPQKVTDLIDEVICVTGIYYNNMTEDEAYNVTASDSLLYIGNIAQRIVWTDADAALLAITVDSTGTLDISELSSSIYELILSEEINTTRGTVGSAANAVTVSAFSGQTYTLVDNPSIYVPDYIRDLNNNLSKLYFYYCDLNTMDLDNGYYLGDGSEHTAIGSTDQSFYIPTKVSHLLDGSSVVKGIYYNDTDAKAAYTLEDEDVNYLYIGDLATRAIWTNIDSELLEATVDNTGTIDLLELTNDIYNIIETDYFVTTRGTVGVFTGIDTIEKFSGRKYIVHDAPEVYVPDYIRDLNNNLTQLYFTYDNLNGKNLDTLYYQGDGYSHTTEDTQIQTIYIPLNVMDLLDYMDFVKGINYNNITTPYTLDGTLDGILYIGNLCTRITWEDSSEDVFAEDVDDKGVVDLSLLTELVYEAMTIHTGWGSVAAWEEGPDKLLKTFSDHAYPTGKKLLVPDYIRDLNNNLTKLYIKYKDLNTLEDTDLTDLYYQGDGSSHSTENELDNSAQTLYIPTKISDMLDHLEYVKGVTINQEEKTLDEEDNNILSLGSYVTSVTWEALSDDLSGASFDVLTTTVDDAGVLSLDSFKNTITEEYTEAIEAIQSSYTDLKQILSSDSDTMYVSAASDNISSDSDDSSTYEKTIYIPGKTSHLLDVDSSEPEEGDILFYTQGKWTPISFPSCVDKALHLYGAPSGALCFTNDTNSTGTITFTKKGSPTAIALQTSTGWTLWSTATTYADTFTLTLPARGTLYLQASNSALNTSFNDYWTITCDLDFAASGNVMSLLNYATTMPECGFCRLFSEAKTLKTAPELPATTLATSCYFQMFYGCTSLETAPELPATTLKNCCYQEMFELCTSLTEAPVLPATTLAGYCYQYMFSGCTLLTTAPVLPATTLADGCYWGMFNGCSTLNEITCLATNISATGCTSNWVKGVASSGTFYKNPSKEDWEKGTDGIPDSWMVMDYDEDDESSSSE